MHIEQNICENFIGTILNIIGKTKDTKKAMLDLKIWELERSYNLERMESHVRSLMLDIPCPKKNASPFVNF
jgi:hypothetical protein